MDKTIRTPIKDHVQISHDEKTDQVQVQVDFDPKNQKANDKKDGAEPANPPLIMDQLNTIADNPLLAEVLSDAAAAIGPQDRAGKAAISQAKTGRDLSAKNESFYMKLNSKTPDAPRVPGEHENKDGSRYTVDKNGKISSFTTASTLDFPQGLKYSNIRYDDKGEMLSCDTPFGTTFTRTTATDDKGFATWTCTQAGRPVPYVGAAASTWKGECSLDENGFHSFVLSGAYQNNLYTRAGDGSMITTRALQSQGSYTGLETVATLADQSRVLHKSNFKNGQAEPENKVEVTDPEKRIKRTIEINPRTDVYKITDKQKVTPENPQIEKMKDQARDKMMKSRDPVGDIKDTLKKLDQLRSATVNRVGSNSFHIDAHFDTSSTMPAVDLHRRFISAGNTHLDPDISFTLTPSNGGFAINNMSGFRSSVTGPFGGVHPTYPTSLFIGRDSQGGYLDVSGYANLPRRSLASSMRLRQSNLPPGNPMTEMMDDPNQLKNLSSAMRLFQGSTDVDQVSIKRVAKGYFDINAVSRGQTHIPVDEQIGEHGLSIDSIDIDKVLFARLSQNKDGVSMEYIRGMTVNASSPLLGDLKIQPIKVGIKNGPDGKPLMEMEIQTPALKDASLSVEVPAKPGEKPTLKSATIKFKVPIKETP